MKIQPEAHNAIMVILDDGSEFSLHHTLHGDKDRLIITRLNGMEIAVYDLAKLDWEPLANRHMIRLTAIE